MIKKLKLLLILFFFYIFTTPALAGFGVSPADISNNHLKPGDNFEKEITLSRSDINEDLKVTIETDLKEAEDWFQFEPGKEFIFPTGQARQILKIKVNVPNNAELKTYQGIIRIKASPVDSKNSGVSIVKGARMEVNLVTTSFDINTLVVKGMSILEINNNDPIKLLLNIENKGNTQIAPSKVTIEIQDLTQKTIGILEDTNLEKIDPNTSKEIIAEFKNSLKKGEYFGLIKVYLDNKVIHSDRLVFKVNETSSVNNQQKTSVNNNAIIFKYIGYSLVLLLPVIFIIILWKKTNNKKLKKIYLFLIILYPIIYAIFGYLYYQKLKADMAKPGDTGSVQGDSIVAPTSTPTPVTQVNSALKVDQDNTNGYPVYRTPDVNSFILYRAQEDEELQVIDEQDGWYQVSTGDGIKGWLQKTSVKSSQ